MGTAKSSFPPELLALDQQIGEFMEYWGFKRIHGRVWLHLFISSTPLDVAELMRRLRVSKTLMSFCIRELKDFSVILEDGVAKHGTVLYRANPNLFRVIQNVLRTRERPLLGRIRAAQQIAMTLPESELSTYAVHPTRIRELGKLVQGADRALQMAVRFPTEDEGSAAELLQMLELMAASGSE